MWMKKQSPDRASSAPSSSCDKLCHFLALWAAGSALGELGLRQRLTHGDCSGLRSRQTWPGPGTVECKEKRLIKRIYGGIAHHCRWLLDVLTRRFVACWQHPPPLRRHFWIVCAPCFLVREVLWERKKNGSSEGRHCQIPPLWMRQVEARVQLVGTAACGVRGRRWMMSSQVNSAQQSTV